MEASSFSPLTEPNAPLSPPPPPVTAWWLWPLRFLFIFFCLSLVLFVVANWNGLRAQLAASTTIRQTSNLPTATSAAWQSDNSQTAPVMDDNSLFIPRLGIRAPLALAPDNQPSTLYALLKNAVVQLADTPSAGQTGNLVIAGHSSSYLWDKSQQYGTVFASLPKLQPGDLIWIKVDNVVAGYTMDHHLIIKPTDVSVLQTTETATLTLFTCYPIGTTLNRYIVVGQLIYPTEPLPPTNQNTSNPTVPSLPAIR